MSEQAWYFLGGMVFMDAIWGFFILLKRYLYLRALKREWEWHQKGWND